MQPKFVHYNGKLFKSNELLIPYDSHGLKYGDGFFTTMLAANKKIFLEALHLQRINESLHAFGFDMPRFFTDVYILQNIKELLEKNDHSNYARVRLMIYRDNATKNFPSIIIESWAIDESVINLNDKGFKLGYYKEAVKAYDNFSHLKTNNRLNYTMASVYAKQQQLDDVLLFNPHEHITDSTIANIFIEKNNIVKTPALTEGCVSGIMRLHLLHCMKHANIAYEETILTAEDIADADEVFLTNALYGIRWVQQINSKEYTKNFVEGLHQNFVQQYKS